ncbi:hypothetical protein FRC08_006419 [Ceratobasidium sp. 394]|nr:hypothetical protein FRC08_006419 [Ceratobasidium sp. 394]
MHHSNILVVPAVEGNEAVNIHWRLDAWLSELPTEILVSDHSSPVLLPHIITVNISYWWLVLRLHQPFYRVLPDRHAPPVNASRPFGDLSDVLCDRAAHKIIFLVDLYNRWHGLRFFPRNMIQVGHVKYTIRSTAIDDQSILQVIFAAGTIFFKQQVAVPDGGQYSETRAAIQGCIATLRTIAGTWHCAERYAARLQALLQDQTPQPRAQTGYFPPPDAWR